VDADLRRIERLARQGDEDAGYLLHIERSRRGLPLLPDMVYDFSEVEHDVDEWLPYTGQELTVEREFVYFFPNRWGAVLDLVSRSIRITPGDVIRYITSRSQTARRTLGIHSSVFLHTGRPVSFTARDIFNNQIQDRLYTLFELPARGGA
jgi:hypothetical protein